MFKLLLPAVVLLASHAVHGSLSRSAITPELSQHIENVLSSELVPGLTLGIVHPTGETEVGAWGIRSENRDLATADVRQLYLCPFEALTDNLTRLHS